MFGFWRKALAQGFTYSLESFSAPDSKLHLVGSFVKLMAAVKPRGRSRILIV